MTVYSLHEDTYLAQLAYWNLAMQHIEGEVSVKGIVGVTGGVSPFVFRIPSDDMRTVLTAST